MNDSEKITGVAITAKEMNEAAEKAIQNYREKVRKENGGSISRAKAIVAILERSDFAQASA
jgi:exopolyphosphatase/pppGpp-phosphohydrolase